MRRESLLRAPKLPLVLLFASLVFIHTPPRVFWPVRSAASAVMLWPRRAVAAVVLASAEEQTVEEKLRAEIGVLENRVIELESEIAEKDRKIADLSHLNQMPSTQGWGFIAANIIGTDASVWGGTVEIDAGFINGVEPGSGVVTDGAVFGSVIEVHKYTSRVRRVTDPGWTAAGTVVDAGVRGVVRGGGMDGCAVTYVVSKSMIKEDSIVTTSGTDGVFPNGIVVGKVTRCSWHKQGLSVNLDVEPAADPGLASTVIVLKPLATEPR